MGLNALPLGDLAKKNVIFRWGIHRKWWLGKLSLQNEHGGRLVCLRMKGEMLTLLKIQLTIAMIWAAQKGSGLFQGWEPCQNLCHLQLAARAVLRMYPREEHFVVYPLVNWHSYGKSPYVNHRGFKDTRISFFIRLVGSIRRKTWFLPSKNEVFSSVIRWFINHKYYHLVI